MELSDTDLDILLYGLEDRLEKLDETRPFVMAEARKRSIIETRELIARIERERTRRRLWRETNA